MGDSSSHLLCERFRAEFEGELVKLRAPTSAELANVLPDLYLSWDDNFEVRLYAKLRAPDEEDGFEIMFAEVLYTPYMDDADLVSFVATLLDITEDAARERLVKAEVIQ